MTVTFAQMIDHLAEVNPTEPRSLAYRRSWPHGVRLVIRHPPDENNPLALCLRVYSQHETYLWHDVLWSASPEDICATDWEIS